MQKIIPAVSVHKNDKATAERYWLTVLAMYTGARLEELGQSDIADIKNQNGIIYLDIHNNGEDRSLKTHSSKRFVPLHADLLELGFMDYVKSLDGTKLFPNLKPNVNGSLTATFSKWYNKYARRTVGIEDSRKVFHSFRHAFKERCREAGIMTEVHDRLTGHTPANVGGSYGDYPLTVLSEAIGKLRFPIV
jgi:integrase